MSCFSQEILLNGCVKGLCKDQDHIVIGESSLSSGEKFVYGILLDGHGNNTFIDFIKTFDWCSIISSDENLTNVWINLRCHLDRLSGDMLDLLHSGSTLVIVRMFSNRIQSMSVGDSRVIIYKNNTFIYGNTPHNLKNPLEIERLKTHKHTIITERYPVPEIRNSKILQSKPCIYIRFSYDVRLALTQSIGHCNITGYQPEFHTEFFEESDKIRIILGSDGFFDMIILSDSIPKIPESEITVDDNEDIITDEHDLLTMSADQLVEKAETRWRKEDWFYHYDSNDYSKRIRTGFTGVYDDIAVIVLEKN